LSERYDEEEKARREAEERRRANPPIDAEGRRRDALLNDERYEPGASSSRSGSRIKRRLSEVTDRVLNRATGRRRRGSSFQDQDAEGRRRYDPQRYRAEETHTRSGSRLQRGLSEVTERVMSRSPRRGRRRGSDQDQISGLYGSQVGANMLRSAVAEIVGTFILVFTGTAVATAAILERSTAGPYFYDSLAVALAFGLALAVVVAAIGHVSGAHVNPAVTLGLAATKKFPWQHVPTYVGAQLLGGILGAIGTWIVYGGAAREAASLAATFPAEGVGDIRALLVEILITFILIFTVISVATDDRVPAGVAPLAVGFALASGVLIGGPVTGGSLNPARTLGPMIMAGEFTAVWVYILGPIIGGVLAAVLYDRFVSEADATE
jgi:MIP family channel proteins